MVALVRANVIECYVTQTSAPASTPWDIVITEWALDSYLNLRSAQTFTDREYWSAIRPDVVLLRGGIPSQDPRFANPKFWGPAKQGVVVLRDGYKMKWHQVGTGKVQLRLPVMAGPQQAFLCQAYVKANTATEQRMIARFKTHMNLISQGKYIHRGAL